MRKVALSNYCAAWGLHPTVSGPWQKLQERGSPSFQYYRLDSAHHGLPNISLRRLLLPGHRLERALHHLLSTLCIGPNHAPGGVRKLALVTSAWHENKEETAQPERQTCHAATSQLAPQISGNPQTTKPPGTVSNGFIKISEWSTPLHSRRRNA
jgi:hypothetical protein